MNKKFNQEHIIGIICIIIALVVFYLTRNFPAGKGTGRISGPAFFPNVLGGALILLGVAEIISGTFTKDTSVSSIREILRAVKTVGSLKILIFFGLFIFFILGVEYFGFVATAMVFLILSFLTFGIPFLRNILYSVSLLLVIIVVFEWIFSVSLPSGVFF